MTKLIGSIFVSRKTYRNSYYLCSFQKLGCMAVRNLVARCPENRQPLIECQVEELIHLALKTYETDYSLKDVAKAALRDLNLKVNLEEQWKGIGGEIGR